jgi:uncharacterized RDD family membrane protein YckC
MSTLDDIAVLTSENVRLNYTLAGIGSRVAAFLADSLVIGLVSVALTFVFMSLGLLDPSGIEGADQTSITLKAGLYIATLTFLYWGYYFFFEWMNWGQTPGKQLVGIRVAMADGAPVDLTACALRNIIRIIDLALAAIGVTFFIMIFTPRYQRLGDIAAGTVVVKRRQLSFDDVYSAALDLDRRTSSETSKNAEKPVSVRLSDQERLLVERFSERRESLPPDVRKKLAADLASRIRSRVANEKMADLSDEELIIAIYKQSDFSSPDKN